MPTVKINIIKRGAHAVAITQQSNGQITVAKRLVSSYPGANFTRAADSLAAHLIETRDNIAVSVQDVLLYEKKDGALVWSAFDEGLTT